MSLESWSVLALRYLYEIVKEHRQPYLPATIFYHKVTENLSRTAKLNFLTAKTSVSGVEWRELHPDENHNWLTEYLRPEFDAATFLPIGTKEAKAARLVEVGGAEVRTIFKMYSRGAETTRDSWMYDFDAHKLATKANSMIETYNAELARWIRAGSPKDIDSFVLADERKIKWCSRLKEYFVRRKEAKFDARGIRNALYRPFTRQFLYFDNIMTHRQGLFPSIFPNVSSEAENIVIVVSDHGYRAPFSSIVANIMPDFHLLAVTDAFQCFPYYIFAEDGTNRRENITHWALSQFQMKYSPEVTKLDIFHYVYAMLHHPQYRDRYAENLKRELPHIPLLHTKEAFLACVNIGKELMDIHLNYEQAKEYPLKWNENKEVPFSWRVEKMRVTPDRMALTVNESLTLSGIPQESYHPRDAQRGVSKALA